MTEKVLVVAVHPDDETLGCGGTLLKHKSDGEEIHWLICTEMKEADGFSSETIEKRGEEIDTVTKFYEFDSISRLGCSTAKLDEYTVSDLVKKISEVMNKVRPTVLYLPFKSDVHSDHRIIFDAVYSCTKSFRYSFLKKIYMMETLSETEFSLALSGESFVPNVFVDISPFLKKKLEVMRVYNSELGNHPFPRSEQNIEALATFRGATAGCNYSEAFMLLKEIKS